MNEALYFKSMVRFDDIPVTKIKKGVNGNGKAIYDIH